LIRFCKATNPTNPLYCDECLDGFSLNFNKTQCIDCHALTPGCTKCTSEILHNLKGELCIECAEGMKLNKDTGKCEFEDNNCFSWIYIDRLEVKCLECSDGFGIKVDGSCEECEESDCIDCKGEETDKCLLCGNGKIANERGDCVWPEVANCLTQQNDKCVVCKNGFYAENGKCVSCELEGCLRCKLNEDVKDCTFCVPGYKIVFDYTSDGIPQHTCKKVGKERNLKECSPFEFLKVTNGTESCVECEEMQEGCLVCNQDGSKC